MLTFTTDGIVVENVILYNFVYDLVSLFYFILFYSLIMMLFNLDVIDIVFICFILFHFIPFHFICLFHKI